MSTAIAEVGFYGVAEGANRIEAGLDQGIEGEPRLRVRGTHDRNTSASVTNGQPKIPVKPR
jgi:hypothetical protein